MDRSLIEQYATGGEKLRRALAGLSREDLLAKPGPGKWSIQELVIHLADSDAIAIDRMKRILTENNPPLLYADEQAYTEKLFCDEQSIDDAVLLFDVGRRQWARVLRKLPDEAFDRVGTHNRRGQLSLEHFVTDYIEHVDHHLKFLYGKRERLGKPIG
jgi:uncharacterized damage-inducible protein DinB